MPKTFVNIQGQTFGRLTVVSYAGTDKHGKRSWLCICTCGAAKTAPYSGLLRGSYQSCGCLHKESTSRRNRERTGARGGTNSPEYRTWQAMQTRCYNQNVRSYKNYGGRGIVVAPRWLGLTGFATFLSDMGRKPSKDHSIDRIDVNGHYSPDNCRWASQVDQQRNKTNNRKLTINGETRIVAEWVEAHGLSYQTVHSRITKLGWDSNNASIIQVAHHVDHRVRDTNGRFV